LDLVVQFAKSESMSAPPSLPGDAEEVVSGCAAAAAEELRDPAKAAAATVPAVTRRNSLRVNNLSGCCGHIHYLPSFGRAPRHGGGVKRHRRSVGNDEADQRMAGEQALVRRVRPFGGSVGSGYVEAPSLCPQMLLQE
jgi:hypothetical protein